MGRWRPPQQHGSKYSTPSGAARMRAELEQLWRVERPQVTQAVAEAAAQGDRSENAEYIYGKRRLREIDRRVRFLRKRLDGLVIVETPPSDTSRVYFGAWVELEDASGNALSYRIVGPDEFDAEPGYISMDSPMAKALLGRRLDDEIEVPISGRPRFVVTAIRYSTTGGT